MLGQETPTTVEVASHRSRPIDAVEVLRLYRAAGWWPAGVESDVVALYRRRGIAARLVDMLRKELQSIESVSVFCAGDGGRALRRPARPAAPRSPRAPHCRRKESGCSGARADLI